MLEKMKGKILSPYIYTLGIIVVYVILISLSGNITGAEAAMFLLFQIFAVFLCGYVIVRLLKIPICSDIQMIGLAYATGYILQIINYYLLVPFGGRGLLPVLIVLEVLLAGAYLIYKRDFYHEINDFRKDNLVFLIFLIAVFIMRFFLCFAHGFVSYSDRINIYPYINDIFYHAENTVSAKYEFPLSNMRWLGDRYYYHYFSSIENSIVSTICNIPVAKLETQLDHIQPTIMLIFSFFSLLQQFCIKASLKIWALLAVFFTVGNEYLAMVTWTGHFYIAPFGFDVGLSLTLFLTLLVIKQFEIEFDWKILVLSTAFCTAATGAKGPCTFVSFAGIGILLLSFLIKKEYKKCFIYGLCLSISFILVYLLVLTNIQGGSDSVLRVELFQNWMTSLRRYGVWYYYDKCIVAGCPKQLAIIITVMIWLYEIKPCIFMGFIAAILIMFFCKKKWNAFAGMLGANLLFGIFLVFLLSQRGNSEMYFVMTGYTYAAILVAYLIGKSNITDGWLSRLLIATLCVGLLLGFAKMPYEDSGTYFVQGYYTLAQKNYIEPDVSVPKTIRKDEVEAYDWIRNNTTFEDILITDLFLLDNQDDSFLTSTFTERRLWLDAWRYLYTDEQFEMADKKREILRTCYENDETAIERVKQDGVTYMIHIIDIDPKFDLDKNLGYEVFRNSGVVVYCLR